MNIDETGAFSDPAMRRACADALADVAPNAQITSDRFDADGTMDRHWSLATDLGWTAVLVPEVDGGLGLDLSHVADICEEMGRNLFCGPFAETAVLGTALAREVGGVFGDIQADIASGRARIGYCEAAMQRDGAALIAQPVEYATGATHVLLFDRERSGALRLTTALCSGAAVQPLQPLDPTAPIGRVSIGDAGSVESHVLPSAAAERVVAPFQVAIAAELLGVGEAALARAVEHAKSRRQFGQPIGAFQTIKHRLADCRTALTSARLAIARAAQKGASPTEARLARILAADAATGATAAALRALGGSGFSWEVDLHLYFKRARRLAARNGGTTELRRQATDAFVDKIAIRA